MLESCDRGDYIELATGATRKRWVFDVRGDDSHTPSTRLLSGGGVYLNTETLEVTRQAGQKGA